MDTPNSWTSLSKYQQNEARRISARITLPTATVSQVAKWLDAFRDFAGGRIDEQQLWERTGHAHGSPAMNAKEA